MEVQTSAEVVERDATVHLLVDHTRNRELLQKWLSEEYDVLPTEADVDETVDLCLVDQPGFVEHQARLTAWKSDAEPVFAPVMLLSEDPPGETFDHDAWLSVDGHHVVDDVVSVPIEQALLHRRLQNLLERRRLSQQLSRQYRRSEERFSSLFHATPDPAVVLSADGAIGFVNDAFCSITGTDRESLVGLDLRDVPGLPASMLDTVEEAAANAIAGEWDDAETIEYTDSTGRHRWVELNVGALTVDDTAGAVVVLRDITERRERERELARSEARFSQIAEHVREVIWMVTADVGELLYMSPSVETLLGESPDDIETDPAEAFFERMHEDDVTETRAWLDSMVEDVADGAENAPYHTEFRLRSPDGLRWIELDGYPVRDEDGTVDRLVGILDDITGLKERERRFNAIFNHTFQLTGLLQPDGTVIEANEAALNFGGVERDDIVGKSLPETAWWAGSEVSGETIETWLARARDGEFIREEVEIKGAEELVTIDFSLKPIFDSEEVVLLVAEGRDISTLKARERELERQNERLEEFASVVSHDLRNPLQVIQSRAEIHEDDEHIDAIEEAADRMEELIDGLLALSHGEQAVDSVSTLDLEAVATAAWQFITAADATLTIEGSRSLAGDESRLQQLFENLFRNAVEHASTGSRTQSDDAVEHGGADVTITVGDLPDGFYVADDGPGIPESEREKVFRMGHTRDGGTGFGLSIVKDVVDAHDWEITVTESEQGGARFEITGLDAD